MVNEYLHISNQLNMLAEKVRNQNISLSDVPYDNIISIICNIYDEKGDKQEAFCGLYGELISKGLVYNDPEIVAYAIEMFAQHASVFAYDKAQLNAVLNEKYRLQCRVAYYQNCEKVRMWNERNESQGQERFKGKGVIYSAITGGYDNINEPQFITPEFRYILFTDNPALQSDVWDIVLVDNVDGLDSVRLARKIKILGHPLLGQYDYSIWVDGNMRIVGDFNEFVEKYRKTQPMLCFNHSACNCIYEEKERCKLLGKDLNEIMEVQISRYRKDGYPQQNGMIESGILIREHNDKRVKQLMDTWWNEVLHGSKRDQLSFNYSCWKNNFVYDTCDLSIYDNKYIKYYIHVK